jgi:hypothetical protein
VAGVPRSEGGGKLAEAPPTSTRLPLLAPIGRLLTFRASREELAALDHRHLAVGLGMTWLVGMGRTWDDPTVEVARRTGLGSVAYVVVLSLVLWLVLLPLRRPVSPRVGYRQVLTFVSCTAPPAALYAIPVERFVSIDAAIQLNLAFLAIVAAWRVALLLHFFARAADLRWYAAVTAALLPIALIVTTLTSLKLAEGAIQIMGGLRERTAEDGVNGVLLLLTIFSYVGAVPLILIYLVLCGSAWAIRRAATPRDA